MPWSETATNMTSDGTDLVLDIGAEWGTYETTAAKDMGELCWHKFTGQINVSENPADTGSPKYVVEINTSEDNVVWSGYFEFQNGEYYCRYFKAKVTVYGDAGRAQRPKLTAFNFYTPPVDSEPHIANVLSTQAEPPATVLTGQTYLVDPSPTAGKAFETYGNWIAIVMEPDTPTFRFVYPHKGMITFHETDNKYILHTENAEWVDYDIRKNCNGHIEVLADSWNAMSPASKWTLTIDTGQICNFVYSNYAGGTQADLDQITYYLCLSIGTYTLEAKVLTDADFGKLDFDLTGPATIGTVTFDLYSAAPTKNVRKLQTGISITRHGLYLLTVKVNGKNGASSDYKAAFTKLCFWRTA